LAVAQLIAAPGQLKRSVAFVVEKFMLTVPETLDGAVVLYYTLIDQRQTPTGNTRHTVAREPLGVASGLAICRYDDGSFYLFYCDGDWNVRTDTYHTTLEDAMAQAEFEYRGVTSTWVSVDRGAS
jgi:hypothetical protein